MPEPKVRFKRDDGCSYPEWQEKPLSVLAEFSKGQGYTKSDLKESGSPIILYGRLYTNYQTVIKEVDTFADMKGKSVLSKKGDVIVPASGETADDISVASAVNSDGIILGGDLNIIHPCADVAPNFLAYSLTFGSPHQEMARRAQGKSIVHLHNDDLKSALIAFPCFEEQQKIADFLSSVDEVISASEEEITNLEKQKKAVMKKIFAQKMRFRRGDGTEFPEWEEKTLGEVCEPLQYGMNAAAGKYDGRNKYIRITDIDDSTHAYLEDNVVSPTGELSDKYLVCKGDILLARTGASTGKTYLYNEKDGRMYFAGFLIRAHVKDGYDDYFVYSQTLTYAYEKWVKLTSQRSGQPGINAEEYSGYILQIPCLEEQRFIANFLSSFDEAIAAAKKELELWKELKKGLLQQMFV